MSDTAMDLALRLGSRFWPAAYGDNQHDDAKATEEIRHLLYEDRFNENLPLRRFTASVKDRRADVHAIDATIAHAMMWCAKWVDGGCRSITADAKYWAAMAQTNCNAAVDELHVPWPAFAMIIPRGLIVDADGHEYTFACFGQFENIEAHDLETESPRIVENAAFYSINADDDTSIHSFWPGCILPDLMCGPDPDEDPDLARLERGGYVKMPNEFDLQEGSSEIRIRELVKRAAVGLLLTMQHTNHFRFGGYFDRPGNSTKVRTGPPPHRTIFIGRPLSIDVTEAVKMDARAGSRAAPSVQTLVRGHRKRQVVGLGGKGRKLVWIEPYWRGPENAPILARPYKG